VTLQDQELLAVGHIVKPVGVRGEVAVRPLSDTPGRFRSLRTAQLGPDAEHTQEITIEQTSENPRGVRIKLKGVNNREAAEGLVGKYLFVAPRHRVKLPRGKYFVHQVIGLAVVDSEGHALGHVRDVLKFPANDVYVIEYHGREILIPAVKEFVLALEPQKGTMRVRLIEGMLGE